MTKIYSKWAFTTDAPRALEENKRAFAKLVGKYTHIMYPLEEYLPSAKEKYDIVCTYTIPNDYSTLITVVQKPEEVTLEEIALIFSDNLLSYGYKIISDRQVQIDEE